MDSHILPTGNAGIDTEIRVIAEQAVRDRFAGCEIPPNAPTREWLADIEEKRLRDFSRLPSFDAGKRLLARLLGWAETVEGPTWERHEKITRHDETCWRLTGQHGECRFGDFQNAARFRAVPDAANIIDPREALIAALLSL